MLLAVAKEMAGYTKKGTGGRHPVLEFDQNRRVFQEGEKAIWFSRRNYGMLFVWTGDLAISSGVSELAVESILSTDFRLAGRR